MEGEVDLNAFLMSVEKKAYAMAVLSVRNREDALDIVQDVMFTLARKYADKTSEEWRLLFYRMLKNRITDWHRANGARRRVFGWFGRSRDDEMEPDPIARAAADQLQEPDFQYGLDGLRDALITALAALPDRQRQAFMLRAWEGMDVKETASAMAVSEGSVKTHYSRAVRALRGLLEANEVAGREESSND